MKCPRKNCNEKANEHAVFGILPCDRCQKRDAKLNLKRKYQYAHVGRLHRIQEQWDHHGKDILPAFIGNKPSRDFAKAYPERAEQYYKKKELLKL